MFKHKLNLYEFYGWYIYPNKSCQTAQETVRWILLSLEKKICFAVLVHENKELVRELLNNIRFYCPNSSIVLFNGGDDPELCEGLGYPVCPRSRELKYGFLSIYHLEVMKWLEDIDFPYQYLINLDSDSLFGRKGFEEFIIDSMEDTDYMAAKLRKAHKKWYPAKTFNGEKEKWEPLFNVESFYGVFNVGQVFSRNYIQTLLNSPQLPLLTKNIAETKTHALEEIVYVNMARQLGLKYKSYPNEAGSLIRYRPFFSYDEVIHHLNEGEPRYLFHPVRRNKHDGARILLNHLLLQEIQQSCHDSGNLGYIPNIDQVKGVPSLLSDNGLHSGPNEWLAPLKSGRVANWRKLADNLPWFGPYVFGGDNAEAVTMIKSKSGYLEAVIRHDQKLAHYWRDEQGEICWHMSTMFGSNTTGIPILVENKEGDFEVVAPLINGGLGYWCRDNKRHSNDWEGPVLIDSKNIIRPLSILRNENEQLVIVAFLSGKLVSYVREDGIWIGPLVSFFEGNIQGWSGLSG